MIGEVVSAIGVKPYYRDEWCAIYHADCRDILPDTAGEAIDLVLTDPPYPDQHAEYGNSDISVLRNLNCRQFVFWSAKEAFPLDYSAIHIWDKERGCASEYERIFERNGHANYKLFRYFSLDSYRARSAREVFTGHPSQKPQRLIERLITMTTASLILDPFLGSGTSCYCAKKLNRYSLGIEIKERYCQIAVERLRQSVMTLE